MSHSPGHGGSQTSLADSKSSRRWTLLEKILTLLTAVLALATAAFGLLNVQTNQDKQQAQSSADVRGSDLSTLQSQYNQLKTQNALLQSKNNQLQSRLDDPSGTSQPGAAQSPSGGTQLGSYDINLPVNYSVPLGPTAPTQAQFSTGGVNGDIWEDGPLLPVAPDKMLNLAVGTTPTYQSCTTDTVFETQATNTQGSAFCLVETGRIAGVTVTSLNATQPNYVVLHVVVWQDA